MRYIQTLKCFKWLWQLLDEFLQGKDIKYHHVFLCGGRDFGKTYTAEQATISYLIKYPNSYLQMLRATDNDVKVQKYSEVVSMFNILGLDENDYRYNAGMKTFTLKHNYNKIILDSLNEENNPPVEGGKINLPIQPANVQHFINFYEEANQIHPVLIDQHQISTRAANRTYQVLNIYAWNPYRGNDWCTALCEKLLPPDMETLATKGYQIGYFPDYKDGSGAIVFRGNFRLNKFISKDSLKLIEAIKEIDFERYKVVGLGMSGNIFNSIYQANLLKARKSDINAWRRGGILIGGVDPGWTESDTACILINASKYLGVDILSEYGIMNKSVVKPEDYVKQNVTTEEMYDKVITFYKNALEQYHKPIKVFVDNAAYPDFYNNFNNRLAKHGLHVRQIEFLPAKKQGQKYNVGFRIDTLRYMLAEQILGISKEITPHIYNDLYNCHYEEVKVIHEDTKQKRSHEWTHFLNALEYSLCELFYHYRSLNPMYFEK